MSDSSNIGWTDATWPIIAGCTYASPGCSNCWAVRDSWRLSHNPHQKVREAFAGTVKKQPDGKLVWTGVVRPITARLDWPLKWRKGRRIFVCSQSDLFHPEVPDAFIDQVFAVMALAPQHTFQVLTKHPDRALAYMVANGLPSRWADAVLVIGERLNVPHVYAVAEGLRGGWRAPLPNVWFGVTVEDQKRADERIPLLQKIPAAVRWLSVEPMLERIHLGSRLLAGIAWVVNGGESAQTRSSTRQFLVEWAVDLLAQCRGAGVAFFMKQMGSNAAMRQEIDGLVSATPYPVIPLKPPAGKSSRYKFHEPQHWIEALRVQEFPDGA